MSSRDIRSSALLVALFVGAALVPFSLRAQQVDAAGRGSVPATNVTIAAPVQDAATTPTAPVGPRAMPAGIVPADQASTLNPALPQGDGRGVGAGTNLAMMGAGAAAIVVGLLVGGDGGTLIAVTGGVVALIGFFRFLR